MLFQYGFLVAYSQKIDIFHVFFSIYQINIDEASSFNLCKTDLVSVGGVGVWVGGIQKHLCALESNRYWTLY